MAEAHNDHFGLVGGVFGRRPEFALVAPAVRVAGSVARKMEKLHMRVSSTDIRAPELSNSPQ